MSKKIISLILAVILIVSVVPVALAATKPTVTVSSCSAKPGETITLSVTIESNPGINTFAFGFDDKEQRYVALQDIPHYNSI